MIRNSEIYKSSAVEYYLIEDKLARISLPNIYIIYSTITYKYYTHILYS